MNSFVSFIEGLIKLAIFVAVILAVVSFWGYNKLRLLSENVKEAWSNITVATRKKVSLVNQLIDSVKSYQESEKFVMLKMSDDLTVASLQQGKTVQRSSHFHAPRFLLALVGIQDGYVLGFRCD